MRIPGPPSRRSRAALASWLVVALVAGLLAWLVVRSDGEPPLDEDLNDGGIWVANNAEGRYGRFNKPVNALDGTVFDSLDGDLDVVQQGSVVVAWDRASGVVQALDPATMSKREEQVGGVPSTSEVVLAGATLGAVDPVSGRVWAGRVQPRTGEVDLAAVDARSRPVARPGEDAAMTATASGALLAVSAEEDRAVRLPAGGSGFGGRELLSLPGEVEGDPAMTSVGETGVVLDREADRLLVVGGPAVDVPDGAVLQQPGPAASEVLVGTPGALLAVGLSDGGVRPLTEAVDGEPAAPVRLGACRYGAWAGSVGRLAVQCGSDAERVHDLAPSRRLVFRVNRGEIVLNDPDDGAVWDVESDTPRRLDDWDAFRDRVRTAKGDQAEESTDEQAPQPPRAEDDDLGARPGRTTVLHPLDNDTMPPGGVLSVVSVTDVKGVERDAVRVSPNGQSVLLTLPADARGEVSFDYYADDGRSRRSDSATVTVSPRAGRLNEPPRLRHAFRPREWTVPYGGRVDVPVLGDWRDPADGDPLFLDGVRVVDESTGARAQVAPSGRVRVSAPAQAGPLEVEYDVADGHREVATERVLVRVQERKDRETTPPVAEPDVARGEVGTPIEVQPLLNDLAGSDPADLDAELHLAADVRGDPGLEVSTDQVRGRVTAEARRPGTYFLRYRAGYGNAAVSTGRIRLDVDNPQVRTEPPVAMPDEAVLHSGSSVGVDVLENDLDPAGGVLVVQDAVVDGGGYEVGVVDNRWVKITPTESLARGRVTADRVVEYRISNGTAEATGEVVVTREPPPEDGTPVTQTDRVTVRAGAGVAVPVLDNDLSPAGDELTVDQGAGGGRSGELRVVRLDDSEGPVGQAYSTGRFVRYVAPPDLRTEQTFEATYVARNTLGDSAPGRLLVTVVPDRGGNRPPAPPTLLGRTAAGDSLRIRLPGTGLDPDGDPVTLIGFETPPQLGRVVDLGASSMVYQAFPGSTGTDRFDYQVVDSRGERATGTARVAVVPARQPAAPLAVADQLTVEAGRTARVDLVGNDAVAVGDRVEVQLVDPPEGVRLVSPAGPVEVRTPAEPSEEPLRLPYTISNGLSTSRAVVSVRTVASYNNPPVVSDSFASGGRSDSVTVDVLDKAYDPDGPHARLEIGERGLPDDVRVLPDGRLRVPRAGLPRVVPFRVVDGDGGVATASLYVPPRGLEVPRLVEDRVVRLEPGETRTVRLADHVVDPAGGPVSLASDRADAVPSDAVDGRVLDERTLELTAGPRFRGPAALNVEVTTGTGVDVDETGRRASVSIPVQVGETRPILTCPPEPLAVTQGEGRSLDVASYCNVWTEDPRDAAGLTYYADWVRDTDGLVIVEPEGQVLRLAAEGGARAGRGARLRVSTADGARATIPVAVLPSRPPRLASVPPVTLRPGAERTVDLGDYLTPGIDDPEPTVVSARRLTGRGTTVRASGSRVTVTAGEGARGPATFAVVVSDVRRPQGPSRRVRGLVRVDVLGAPGRPEPPVPARIVRGEEVPLTWRAPESNGAPVDRYDLRTDDGRTRSCPTTSCVFGGLVNGERYRFRVRAVNAIGASPWSGFSRPVTPDALPGQVGPIRMVDRGDGFVEIRWSRPTTRTSAISRYHVSWPGGRTTSPRTSAVVRGLDNNRRYSFTVAAENRLDIGRGRTSPPFQSAGRPGTPPRPRVQPGYDANRSASATVTWPAVDPNGPTPVEYTVLLDGRPVPACRWIRATRCQRGGFTYGNTYRFSVKARNAAGKVGGTGPAATWTAVGTPTQFGSWTKQATGRNMQGTTTFRVPYSKGAQNRVKVVVAGRVVRDVNLKAYEGQQRTLTFGTPNNDRYYEVYLRSCNERACTNSSTKLVQSYGPLGGNTKISVTDHVNRRTKEIWWTVVVDMNGRGGRIYFRRDVYRGSERIRGTTGYQRISGRDRVTITAQRRERNTGAHERMRFWVVDAGRGRRSPTYPRDGGWFRSDVM